MEAWMKHTKKPCQLTILLLIFVLFSLSPAVADARESGLFFPDSSPISSTGTVKVGLFGIGLNTYWGQFPGLRDRLESYLKTIEKKISEAGGCQVISAGLVDTVEKARETAGIFRAAGVRIIFSLRFYLCPVFNCSACGGGSQSAGGSAQSPAGSAN